MQLIYMLDSLQPAEVIQPAEISKLSNYEYIPVVLGGLFGLATIMLVVFSLISNEVTKKTCGFSLINLKRYNRFFLLLPIFLVFATACIMMSISIFNNSLFLIICTIIVLFFITRQTYLFLQPLYEKDKCKNAIINNRINAFKKKIKKANNMNEIEKIICDEEIELFNLISADSLDNDYINFEDKKKIFKSYKEILYEGADLTDNDSINIRFITIGIKIFGIEFSGLIDEYEFPEKLLLNSLLNENWKNFNLNFHVKNLELIHSLFEANRKGAPLEKTYDKKSIANFFLQTIKNPQAINYIIDYVFEAKEWNYGDIYFIGLILRLLYNSFVMFPNAYKMSLNEEKYNKFVKLMSAYKEAKELEDENDEFSKRFNRIIKIL
ncbi:MAG: hypothetical protein PHG18_02770 [Bacilli bacterium]|nr:hypothetical protein [Bacilli bacterium]